MKRFVLTLFLCALTSLCWGKVNTRDTQDVLTYMTDYSVSGGFMKMTTGIALAKATKKSDGTVFWRLGLLYEQGVRTFSQEGSRAVFKTFKGTVVSVCQRTKSSDSVNNRTKLSSTSELYVNKALYEIDEQTLDILISEGIQKMRFETLRGFRDYEYDHDVLGAYLAAEKREIEGMANFGSDF